ncbi:conserved protein of unknown function [Bartonella clarridgeiae 73]|uniref:Uncharacterized protein n=1 Tax=Bartonella clarridgeiae (strain CCUG 45776 / CIP 104772 / 73) TaxID=696125 RepID=E6YHL2_BARC7|nr:hypothetical protein [Bartonella clarridgeiae]WCR55074.1 MAG: hypothetical protein PG977_000467 [Bartonella clarridgeiae]CBI76350.1 conserved protein of unknown function [Bartonella clarridgeiae 73]
MIEKNYPVHEERKAEEQGNCKWFSSIGKSIFTIVLALLIIWFIAGFLGAFWNKSQRHMPDNNTTGVNQTTTNPKKNPTAPSIP